MEQKISEYIAYRKFVKCLFIICFWGICVCVHMCECRSWYENAWKNFVLVLTSILQNQQLYAHPNLDYYRLRSPFPYNWYYDASMMNHCTVGSLCYEVISSFIASHTVIKFHLIRKNNPCNHFFDHKYLSSCLKSD